MENLTIRIIAYTPHKEYMGKASLVTEEEAFEMEELIKSATADNLDNLQFDLEDEGETIYLPREIIKETVFVIRKH